MATVDTKVYKLIKKLPTAFAEEADAMSERQLRDCIVQCEQNIKSAVEGMESNKKFQELKNAYQEAALPLREVKKAQRAKIQYCLHRIEEIGKA